MTTATGGHPTTAPERLAVIGGGLAVVALAWPTLAGATGASLPCPLRAATGVPCPLCGSTTSAVALVRGRLGEALAASPLLVVAAVATAVVLLVLALRRSGLLAPARPWPAAWTRPAVAVALVVAAASEAWQLSRLA